MRSFTSLEREILIYINIGNNRTRTFTQISNHFQRLGYSNSDIVKTLGTIINKAPTSLNAISKQHSGIGDVVYQTTTVGAMDPEVWRV